VPLDSCWFVLLELPTLSSASQGDRQYSELTLQVPTFRFQPVVLQERYKLIRSRNLGANHGLAVLHMLF
jgi:hypothetical protein